MKKVIQFSAAVALMLVIAACSLFKKDIEVPVKFSYDINQTSATAPLQISQSKEVDLSNDEVQKYKDEIDEFEINKITYKVTQFAGTNSPVLSGNLSFAVAGSSTQKQVGTINNLDLKAAGASGNEFEMALANESVRQELITLLKGGNVVTFTLNATTSENPVVASLEFKVYANMTVEL